MNLYIAMAVTAALAITAVAAWTDHRSGRIPNWLTVSGILIGLGIGLWGGGGHGLLLALASALAVALVPLLLFKVNALGGGDVKLFAALGALLGAEAGLEIQMLSFTLGALFGLWVWLRKGLLGKGLGSVAGLALGPLGRSLRSSAGAVAARAVTIRFGPAIFLACAAVICCRLLSR